MCNTGDKDIIYKKNKKNKMMCSAAPPQHSMRLGRVLHVFLGWFVRGYVYIIYIYVLYVIHILKDSPLFVIYLSRV